MSYVIARPDGVKNARLYRTKRGSDGRLVGVEPDHTRYTGEGVTVVIRDSEIVVPLGDDPPYGKVYGVSVEPIVGRTVQQGWGTIYNYRRDLDPASLDRISVSLAKAKRAVERLVPNGCSHEIRTEIRHPSGRIAATYAYRPKGSDVLVCRPQLNTGAREHLKIHAHELGHGVWHRVMTPEQRARWIRLYGRYVQVTTLEVADIRRMVKGIRQIASVRDYLHDCEPEEQAGADLYLGWLKKVHGISPREVQDLVTAGDDLPVPDVHLHRSDLDTPVTLYSKENPGELYCEALSSHVVGDLGDRRMKSMLES